MASKQVWRMLSLRGIALLHDTIMAFAAFFIAILLRLGPDGLLAKWPEYFAASFLFAAIVAVVGFAFGMNRGVWRYASLADFAAIAKTATVSIAVFVVVHFLLVRLQEIPRSAVFITWAFLIVLLAAPRAAYRTYRNQRDLRRATRSRRGEPKRVIVVGANDNADLFLKMIREQTGAQFDVLAIIDERGRRTGRVIRGVSVAGGPEDIPGLVRTFDVRGRRPEAIVVTRSREEYQKYASLERLIEIAGEQRLEVLRLPNLSEMRSIGADFDLRPIKLEDLLQRPVISQDPEPIASLIKGRKILITGAGGSIGSELVRQVTTLHPEEIVLVDASEFLLYSIHDEITRSHPSARVKALLCNVRERDSVSTLLRAERPEVVFHAAALKHVPIVEAQPLEGIHTNALGTRNLADACSAAGVKAMILVSTDKAVNPANVMGATKRLAEMYCQAMDLKSGPAGTRFVTVRFGNVLGSAGSVVPLFEKQIKAGGPITVTHPEIERYFMTIPEACILVLQAAAHALAHDEEHGRIFVLDMGTPVKIVDLARNLIRLSGLRPEIDIGIVFTGLRPGEKLYEELFANRETLKGTAIPGVLSASPRAADQVMMERIFDELERLVVANNLADCLRVLRSSVAEFSPSEQLAGAMLPAVPSLTVVPDRS